MRNKKEQSFLPLLKLPNKLGVKVSTYFNSNTKQSSPLLNLPNLPKELWEEILTYLTVYELVHSKEISKGFKGLIEENRTFKEKLELAKAKRELGTPEYEIYKKSLKEGNESKNKKTVNENLNEPTEKEKIIDQESNSTDLDTGEIKTNESDSGNAIKEAKKADAILLELYKKPAKFTQLKRYTKERTRLEHRRYQNCGFIFSFLASTGVVAAVVLGIIAIAQVDPKNDKPDFVLGAAFGIVTIFLLCLIIPCIAIFCISNHHGDTKITTIENENPFLKEGFFSQDRIEEIDEEKGLSNDNADIQNKGKEKLNEKTPLLTGTARKEEENSDSENYGTTFSA